MQSSEYLEAIRRDADTFAATARKADLDDDVPACPDWSAGDLVHHLGEVHHFWATNVDEGWSDYPEDRDEITRGRPDDAELVDWFTEGVEDLLDVFEEADDDAECWTWWGDNRAVRVKRRMAIETALHRRDVQQVVGDPEPVAADLAVDGIEEFIDAVLPAMDEPWPHDHATIHLHRTDGRGDWQLTVDTAEGERRWARDDAAVVRASASDLLLLMWGRIGADDVRVTGDRDAVADFIAYADLT